MVKLQNFKVGDRVFVKSGANLHINDTGTIVNLFHEGVPEIGVQFDSWYDNVYGHDCHGYGENHRCRYVYPGDITAKNIVDSKLFKLLHEAEND